MSAAPPRPDLGALLLTGAVVISSDNATVLPFRGVVTRGPVDLAARMNPQTPLTTVGRDAPLKIVSLADFAGARRGGTRGDRPDGDAA